MAEYEIEVKCKNCGKPISVLAPSRWGYKKRNRNSSWDYFCTWKCLREDEKKHEKKQKTAEEEKKTAAYRDREDEIRRLIRVVKDGKDPYEHLKGEGYANPKDTMRRLRLQAKDEYPELYTEIVALGLKDMRKGNGKKGAQTVTNKMTPENKEKAIEIAIAGGDYIKHLKECGAANPHASWSYIKQQLAREDPVKYDELMAAMEKRKPEVIITQKLPIDKKGRVITKGQILPVGEGQRQRLDLSEHQPEPKVNIMDEIHEYDVAEHPEKRPEEFTPKHYEKIDRFGIRQETEAALNLTDPEEKPITKALVYDGLTVTAVSRYNFGIHLTGQHGERIAVTWPVEKEDDMALFMKQITELKVEDWKKFMEIMPKAMRILGVNI